MYVYLQTKDLFPMKVANYKPTFNAQSIANCSMQYIQKSTSNESINTYFDSHVDNLYGGGDE